MKLIISFVAVFLLMLPLLPTPIMAKHFIFPVLTGMPKREQISKVKYVLISEKKAEEWLNLTKLSPIDSISLCPPKRAPKLKATDMEIMIKGNT